MFRCPPFSLLYFRACLCALKVDLRVHTSSESSRLAAFRLHCPSRILKGVVHCAPYRLARFPCILDSAAFYQGCCQPCRGSSTLNAGVVVFSPPPPAHPEFISFCQLTGLNEIFALLCQWRAFVSCLGLMLVLSCTLHSPSWTWRLRSFPLRW